MNVCIRLFARARDLAGSDTLQLEMASGATLGEVRRELARTCPALESLLERCALAVNDEFAEDRTPISPGAELAVLPPVSGGCLM